MNAKQAELMNAKQTVELLPRHWIYKEETAFVVDGLKPYERYERSDGGVVCYFYAAYQNIPHASWGHNGYIAFMPGDTQPLKCQRHSSIDKGHMGSLVPRRWQTAKAAMAALDRERPRKR